MPRALLIQLARLGDLVQSLPAITALGTLHSDCPLDLLCPAPLVPLGEFFPAISRVYPWDGNAWLEKEGDSNPSWEIQVMKVKQAWDSQAYPDYAMAYNLNNHPRAIFAAHLLAERVIGPGALGPLNSEPGPWGDYLRTIAIHRGNNRIHLSDAFCGICGVPPPPSLPKVVVPEIPMPPELEFVPDSSVAPIIGLVLGAGDTERRIPVPVWAALIQECLAAISDARVVLIGGSGEREIALALENSVSPAWFNRVVNVCGKTSLPQLLRVLSGCRWLIGSDTGPLHAGVLCGARVIGWYFARARVHETGPYGEGHYVWQYGATGKAQREGSQKTFEPPRCWPVRETVRLVLGTSGGWAAGDWTLWASHHDAMGTYYLSNAQPDDAHHARRMVWDQCSPGLVPTVV